MTGPAFSPLERRDARLSGIAIVRLMGCAPIHADAYVVLRGQPKVLQRGLERRAETLVGESEQVAQVRAWVWPSCTGRLTSGGTIATVSVSDNSGNAAAMRAPGDDHDGIRAA